jgi:hypothetical protein
MKALSTDIESLKLCNLICIKKTVGSRKIVLFTYLGGINHKSLDFVGEKTQNRKPLSQIEPTNCIKGCIDSISYDISIAYPMIFKCT